MKKVRKKYVVISLLFLIILISIVTNPTKQDYLKFSEEQTGAHTPTILEIERINFFIFSTYTPIVHHEHGITHLGLFKNFFQISNGQFDYSWWLEFFK
jgi:hypothetical protein